MVQIDEEGNFTPYDEEGLREEMTQAAWEDHVNERRLKREREGQDKQLFECTVEDIENGDDMRRHHKRHNRHKRRRDRKKVLGGFSMPPGHTEAGTHGRGDWGGGKWSKGEIAGTFKRMKKRKIVPRQFSRKEMWEIALERTYGMGENIAGMVNGMYEQHVCPLEWNNAEAAQLGKSNGKRGCKAIRLINLLAPEGKAFFSLVWRVSPERRSTLSYGFLKRKRREQAILIQNTIGWKLRKLGMGHYVGLHDVANAFPSMGHQTLDQTMDQHAKDGEAGLLKFRYKHTMVSIHCKDGSCANVVPTTGGLQGDSVMANMFREGYDEKMDQWNAEREQTFSGRMLQATIPGTDTYIQVERTTFADDLAETNLADTTGDIERTSRESNQTLDQYLGDAGMAQNADKEELIIRLEGKGSARTSQEIWRGSITYEESSRTKHGTWGIYGQRMEVASQT